MPAKKPADMSNEELLKQEKTIKMVLTMLISMLSLVLIIGIYLTFKNGFNALIIIPISMSSIVMLNFKSLGEIKKEKELRSL